MLRRWNTGFTLVELLMVVAIVSMLIAIAAPSFSEMMQKKRVDTFTAEVVRAVQLARSEAIARNTSVSICSGTAGACSGGATGWNQGFMVFVDDDGDGGRDAGEELLQDSTRKAASGLKLLGSSSSFIVFGPDGSANQNSAINACNTHSYGLGIVVNAVGRPRLSNISASC